jgi:hypothetical protein
MRGCLIVNPSENTFEKCLILLNQENILYASFPNYLVTTVRVHRMNTWKAEDFNVTRLKKQDAQAWKVNAFWYIV